MATFITSPLPVFWNGSGYDYSGEGRLAFVLEGVAAPAIGPSKNTIQAVPVASSITFKMSSSPFTLTMFNDSNVARPPSLNKFWRGWN